MILNTDLEQVNVLAAAAAQGRHVAAGVEGSGLSTLGHCAPAHVRMLLEGIIKEVCRVYLKLSTS